MFAGAGAPPPNKGVGFVCSPVDVFVPKRFEPPKAELPKPVPVVEVPGLPAGVVDPVFEDAFNDPNPPKRLDEFAFESSGLLSVGFEDVPKDPKIFGGADMVCAAFAEVTFEQTKF